MVESYFAGANIKTHLQSGLSCQVRLQASHSVSLQASLSCQAFKRDTPNNNNTSNHKNQVRQGALPSS